jgi:hypothetical protein
MVHFTLLTMESTLIYPISKGGKLVRIENCSNVHYTLISAHTNLNMLQIGTNTIEKFSSV